MEAARFDLQNGDGVVAEGIHLWFPSFFVSGWITPTVVVESEEVASLVIRSAVEVVSGLDTVVVYTMST